MMPRCKDVVPSIEKLHVLVIANTIKKTMGTRTELEVHQAILRVFTNADYQGPLTQIRVEQYRAV